MTCGYILKYYNVEIIYFNLVFNNNIKIQNAEGWLIFRKLETIAKNIIETSSWVHQSCIHIFIYYNSWIWNKLWVQIFLQNQLSRANPVSHRFLTVLRVFCTDYFVYVEFRQQFQKILWICHVIARV